MISTRIPLIPASMLASVLTCTLARAVSAQTVTWKFAHENLEVVLAATAARMVADSVKIKTGGRIEIQIYPAGQLGKEEQLIEQFQLGTLQMVFTPTAPLSNFEPRTQLIDLPYLFPSR